MGGFKKGLVLMKFSTDIVGGSEKVQKYAYVINEWSPRVLRPEYKG